MNRLTKAVWRTLVYADLFDYPLRSREVHRWLIAASASPIAVAHCLNELVSQGQVEEERGYYCLPGRHANAVKRQQRRRASRDKMVIARKTAEKLSRFPWLKLVAVTGALAMGNASPDSDIDLLLVTSSNRLWLTRLLVVLLGPVWRINRRRFGQKEVADRICFNLFLEENSLEVKQQDLFTAHEVAQIIPVFDRQQTHARFQQANLWVNRYLPHALAKISPPALPFGVDYWFLMAFLNLLAYFGQRLYMWPKLTKEKVGFRQAFFHPRPLSLQTLGRYHRRLAEL